MNEPVWVGVVLNLLYLWYLALFLDQDFNLVEALSKMVFGTGT